MMEKKKQYRIVLSAAAWLLTALSSSFAYSFLGDMPWSRPVRFWVGLLLIAAPMAVLWLIVELFRKER